MFRRYVRPLLAAMILLATISAFAFYASHHPQILVELRRLPLSTLLILLFLYVIFLGTLVWIQRATLALCDTSLERRESLLLIMYSSIVNFFGPLQSGPAFRAAYLKRRHNIKIKDYTLATLLYYGFYALFSVLFIATYLIGLWALATIVAVAAVSPIILRKIALLPVGYRHLRLRRVANLAVATLAQVSTFAVIFYVELSSLGKHVSAIPALIYTGAANLALFVSITPGAIGFREAFVAVTQHLHHIAGPTIAAASFIDRGVYVAFLGLQAAIVFGLHAQKYFKRDEP